MERKKLVFSANGDIATAKSEEFRLIKEAGFDGVFTAREDAHIDEFAKEIKELGLIYQSAHATFGSVDALWKENENNRATRQLDELKLTLSKCIKNEIPIMVLHAYIGFDADDKPNQSGIDRFGEIVDMARGSGVSLAFENTEGPEYLEYLMNAYKNERHVGFCWDSGHEMCYNFSKDMLAKYGDRLLCTHLNDNLGIKSNDGVITSIDDLHLLPFDGIADWEYNAKRLKNTGFSGPLTFELKIKSKPGRHENDIYGAMPIESYMAQSFIRACKVRNLYEKA